MASQSLSQSWSDFFEKYLKYYRGHATTDIPLTVAEKWRGFFVKHFTPSLDSVQGLKTLVEQTRREVYIIEGDYAFQQSLLMEHIIKPTIASLIEPSRAVMTTEEAMQAGEVALQKLLHYASALKSFNRPEHILSLDYYRYRMPADVYDVSPATKKILTSENEAEKKLLVASAIRNFLMERVISEALDAEFAKRNEDLSGDIEQFETKYPLTQKYIEFKQNKSNEAFTALLRQVEMNYPIIAWDGIEGEDDEWPLRKAVESCLKRRMQWEVTNPSGGYKHYYYPPDSDFYERILNSPLFVRQIFSTDTMRDERRMTLTPRQHARAMAGAPRKESTEDKSGITPQHSFFPSDRMIKKEEKKEEKEGKSAVARRGSLASSQLFSVKPRASAHRSEISLAHTVESPRFTNMIGLHVFNPALIVDALGQLIFGNLLKASLLYMRWFSAPQKSVWGQLAKVANIVLTIPLLVAVVGWAAFTSRLVTFGIPKVTYDGSAAIYSGMKTVGASIKKYWQKSSWVSKSDINRITPYDSDPFPLPSAESGAGSKASSVPTTPRGEPVRQVTQVSQPSPQTHNAINAQLALNSNDGGMKQDSPLTPCQESRSITPTPPSVPRLNLAAYGVSDQPSAKNDTPVLRGKNSPASHNLNVPGSPESHSESHMHSRTRNRFTFSYQQEHKKSPVKPRVNFEANKTPSLHAQAGSMWEGDFPGLIVVSQVGDNHEATKILNTSRLNS